MVAITAQAVPGMDLSAVEGDVIEFVFEGGARVVLAGVSAFDSEAKAEGTDIFFMVCGDQCADQLTSSYRREITLPADDTL